MKEKSTEYFGRWASPDAERRFRAIEDELWNEAFPTRPETLVIETQVGPTTAYHWPGAGMPLVFLHGMGSTSLMWSRCVTQMSGSPMYAVDTVGDVGRSEQRVAFRDAAHVAEWLDETLAGLGAGCVHLVGASYGGWLAVNQAVRLPSRLASVALVEPVGLVEFDMRRFMLWGLSITCGALMPSPVRRRAAVWTRMPALEDKRQFRMGAIGFRKHPFRLPAPERLTDDQFQAITTPSLILLGEKSAIHRAAQVVERVHSLLPDADVEVVVDAGHALPVSHAELVCDRLRTFLNRVETHRDASA